MNKIIRGSMAIIAVILSMLMLATGAQATTPGQQNAANYISSMRNAAGLPSLNIDEQMNGSAQAWAENLASQDNRNLSGNPNMFQPSGTTGGVSITAYYSRNDPQAAMDGGWGTNANNKSIINTASWNTVGTGIAVAKSGAVYIVADIVHVNPPVVYAAPLPAPAPVAVPAPVAIPQPEPVPAAPVEQAPAAQAEPAPAPAPEIAAPAPEVPKPTEAPKETATPVATPTATPTATESASESAIPSEPGKNMDAMRTSDNESPVLGNEPKQALAFGLGGLLLISGGSLKFANRRQKATSI